MAENELEKWEARQAQRRERVKVALRMAEQRRVAREAADAADNEYAHAIADAVKDGVLEGDLKAMGLDLVEQPRKRSASRSKKGAGAQPVPTRVPDGQDDGLDD